MPSDAGSDAAVKNGGGFNAANRVSSEAAQQMLLQTHVLAAWSTPSSPLPSQFHCRSNTLWQLLLILTHSFPSSNWLARKAPIMIRPPQPVQLSRRGLMSTSPRTGKEVFIPLVSSHIIYPPQSHTPLKSLYSPKSPHACQTPPERELVVRLEHHRQIPNPRPLLAAVQSRLSQWCCWCVLA